MSKASELVKIYREVIQELGEDPQVPVEVIGPWVSTLFINEFGGNSKPATGKSYSEILEVIGNLEAKGKPKILDDGGTQYSIKVNGEWYNCRSLEPFKNRKFDVGDSLIVKYRQNGKYKNLVEVSGDKEPEDIPF